MSFTARQRVSWLFVRSSPRLSADLARTTTTVSAAFTDAEEHRTVVLGSKGGKIGGFARDQDAERMHDGRSAVLKQALRPAGLGGGADRQLCGRGAASTLVSH